MPDFRRLCVDLIRAGRSVRFAASGSSMAPTIRSGDVVTVEPSRFDRLRPGDVVLYATPRGLTLHRVVRRRGDRLVARGDAAGSPDEPVTAAAVLGRAVAVSREGMPVCFASSRASGLHARFRRALVLAWRATIPLGRRAAGQRTVRVSNSAARRPR